MRIAKPGVRWLFRMSLTMALSPRVWLPALWQIFFPYLRQHFLRRDRAQTHIITARGKLGIIDIQTGTAVKVLVEHVMIVSQRSVEKGRLRAEKRHRRHAENMRQVQG